MKLEFCLCRKTVDAKSKSNTGSVLFYSPIHYQIIVSVSMATVETYNHDTIIILLPEQTGGLLVNHPVENQE